MSELFTTTKVRDFDVVILKENGWINYTKLCKDLTGFDEKFRRLIGSNEDMQFIIKEYEKIGTDEMVGTKFTIINLTKIGILKTFNSGVGNDFKGTYGPRYMLDFIIITCNVKYYKLIHEALELIDNYANLNNSSFEDEIKGIEERYLYQIDELKKIHSGEIKKKDDKIDELMKKIDKQSTLIDKQTSFINKQNTLIENQTKKIDEQTKKIDNQTKILTEVKQSLTSIADSVSDLNKHITSNTICKYHILLWLDKENQKKTRSTDDVTIKTFVGLIENTPKLTKTDKILLQENVSCSLDSFKSVLANLSNMAFTTNYRNIIIKQFDLELFITKFKTELIQINTPVNEIQRSLMTLNTTVKEQNTRLDKIENQLNLICQFYGITETKFNEIANGDWTFKFKNRWRDIKINNTRNKLYVNHGKNNAEIYYLDKSDV